MAHKASTDEVLAAVVAGSVYTHKPSTASGQAGTKSIQPLALTDVIRIVAEQHGLDAHTQFGKYETPAAAYARYVSAASVANALRTLVTDGQVIAVTGAHWSLGSVHNTRRNATYYLSREAQDLACAKADQTVDAGQEVRAGEYATRMLVQRHADEFEELKAARLSEMAPSDRAARW